MKFSNLFLLAMACADSAVASRCMPKPKSSSASSVVPSNTPSPSPSSVSSTHSSVQSSTHSSSQSPSPSPSTHSSVHSSSHSPSQSPSPSPSPSSSHSTTHFPSSSSTLHSSTKTTASTSSAYSEPASNCPDLVNGNFGTGQMSPWYPSDQQVTAVNIRHQSPSGNGYAFAMTPYQKDRAQVYINQQLPYCGQLPLPVVIRAQFSYMFTGYSTGCTLNVQVNQGGAIIGTVSQTDHDANTWYTYSGPATHVTLGYTPLFVVQMICTSNTANQDAVLVTNIKAYA
ncbi:hypothetical protein SBRCBS47491_010083 [Sporothrix bragantina]|uniref:Uncharacterized protein n=1 Tax=Sporothrix bragantina TaxID=671064 RepID=A0ABP0D1K8_9PEZI